MFIPYGKDAKKKRLGGMASICTCSLLFLAGCSTSIASPSTLPSIATVPAPTETEELDVTEAITIEAVAPTISEPEVDPAVSLQQELIRTHTLPTFTHWFRSKDINPTDVTKLTFTYEVPEKYDETWFANSIETEDIMAYRKGTEVFIVSDYFYLPKYSMNLFNGVAFPKLTAINGLELLDASRVINTSQMFELSQCRELNVGGWDVSNVRDMSFMFVGCCNLEELDVSNWDVRNVTNMMAMFQGAEDNAGDMKLKELDLSKWQTDSLEEMTHMFYGCAQLKELDLSSWDVSRIESFSHLFADCYSLERIDLSGWDTSNAFSFDAMFNDCRSLTSIDISDLDTKQATQFSQMFESCYSLKEIIGIETMDVSNASDGAFYEMFHVCKSLESLDLSQWDTSQADCTYRMFARCKNLRHLNLSGWDISNIWTLEEMFRSTSNLTIEGISDWDLQGKITLRMY